MRDEGTLTTGGAVVGREPSMAFTPAQSSTVSLRSSFSIKMVSYKSYSA